MSEYSFTYKLNSQSFNNLIDLEFHFLSEFQEVEKTKAEAEAEENFSKYREIQDKLYRFGGIISTYGDLKFLKFISIEKDKAIFLNFCKQRYSQQENITFVVIKISEMPKNIALNLSSDKCYILRNYGSESELYEMDLNVLEEDYLEELDSRDEENKAKISFSFVYLLPNSREEEKVFDYRITKELIAYKISSKKKEDEETTEEYNKEIAEEDFEKKEKAEINRKDYETNSYYIDKEDNIELKGNILNIDNTIFELKKRFCDVFKFDDFLGWIGNRYKYRRVVNLKEILLEKRISFIYGELHNGENNEKERINYYDIEFNDSAVNIGGNISETQSQKINGIPISNSKVNFILNRMVSSSKNRNPEMIKLLNKLTGMKVDILDLKNVSLRLGEKDIETDIEFNIIDKDTFSITFLGITKNVNWDFVKKYFYDDGKSRSFVSNIYPKLLYNLCSEMGISKENMFDEIRKLKLVASI